MGDSIKYKILFVVHGYKPAYKIGGPIHSVSALAESLVSQGHKVIVFTTDSNQDEKLNVLKNRPLLVDGVEVWYFETQNFFQNKMFKLIPYLSKSIGYLYSPIMKKKLNEIIPNIDIVHTHLPFIYPTYIASKLATLHNKPLLYHQRGVLSDRALGFRSFKKKIYINLFEKKIIQNSSCLIALTKYEIGTFKKYSLKEQEIRIIPNGIDITKFNLEDISYNDFNIDDSKIVILFLGRLHPSKGADLLLSAFMKAILQNENLRLIMAGPDEYGLMEEFNQKLKDKKLQDFVFFPGMITGDEKKRLLARADLFVLPSLSEGFSMAILEALASSTAVLISPECNFNEIQSVNAGVVVPNDIELISNMLLELTSNHVTLKKMGENGKQFVKNFYNWEIISKQFIDLYGTLQKKDK
jgi:glycosyltransferase involved in cell wall biosynthesis